MSIGADRAWTAYFANTIQKIMKIQWGWGERPSGYADGLI